MGAFGREARHETAPLETRDSGSGLGAGNRGNRACRHDVLDVMHSRAREQEVLDLLDEQSPTR
jgi:hypothetical protein